MKIKNVGKFVRSVVLLIGVLLAMSLWVSNIVLSHEEALYKKMYTSQGDTIWNIAKQEKSMNEYYENKDVRYIVDNIKEVNNLENSELKIGQEILIPTI